MKSYQQRLQGAGICTILMIGLAGWLLPKQPASSMGSDWFWSNKTHPNRQFEVVAVGDSRIYRGFSPDDFTKTYAPNRTVSILNFGFSSAGLDTNLLRAAAALLDTTAQNPVLLIGITTSSLADENAQNTHFWQEYNRSVTSRWQRKYINPYLTFFDPTRPNDIKHYWQGKRQGYFQKHYANGWVASDKQPNTLWESYAHIKNTYPHVEFSQGLKQALLQQITILQAQGIQVVAFRPPAAAHIEALEMQPYYYPEKVLKNQIEAVGGIWLDLPDRTKYHTYDGSHLVDSSARQLSQDLGRQLYNILQKKADQHIVWEEEENFEQSHSPFITKSIINGTTHKVEQVAAKGFSHTLIKNLNLPSDTLQITATAWVRTTDSTLLEGAVLVLSVEDTSGSLLWKGKALKDAVLIPTIWTPIQLSVPYYHQKQGAVLKAYIWNNSEQGLWLDRIKLECSF